MTLFLIIFEIVGQNLNGFKYGLVSPLIYQDGSRDKYGLEAKAISSLKELGIKYLDNGNTKDWPNDAIEEPCLIAYVRIMDGNMPNAWNCGSVRVQIETCNNQIISNVLLKSKNAICNSPYECCYYKWGEAISTYFKNQTYTYNPTLNKLKTVYPEVEKTNETEETINTYLSSNKIDFLEGIYKSYQTEVMSYYKMGIIKKDGKYKAIIIESDNKLWKQGEVKAVFEQSSMKGVYSVKWYLGDKTSLETFAYMEDEALLTVELLDQKGKKTQQKFIKMYPAASSDVTLKKDISIASGSGFFITTGGILATNAHVVDGAEKIEVTITNEVGNFTYKAKVLLVDAKNDVALLQIEDEKFKGLNQIPFGIIEQTDVGEKVFTIGFPLNDVMGSNFKVTDGIISSKTGIADDIRYYQISVPLQPGNSGGPLFNKEGNVIGLTSARLNSQAIGTNIENVNYAIKSSYLLNLYNMLPNPSKLSGTSLVASKELKEQVKILKNYVCLIKVY